MSLLKGVQFALFLSTASFAGLTLPFVSLGHEAVEIQVNYQTRFSGSLRDLAGPYLGGTMMLSLSLGAAALGVSGWRASRQERQMAVRSLQSFQAELRAQEKQLQSLPFSESRLQLLGLSQFLSEPILSQSLSTEVSSTEVSSTEVLSTEVLAAEVLAADTPSPAQPLLRTAYAFSVQAGYQLQPVQYAPIRMAPVQTVLRGSELAVA
ncbi:MAG: hypothetical protein HC771_19275 [Synechococcales cyanobacterium CRU_2_2]|nr:hypothetical protein [Synechococcales cyanobacterium CRU_2_2]